MLAVSAGEDLALQAELWSAFRGGLDAVRTQLREATTDSAWTYAAHRLRGLAATYGASELAALAAKAEERGRPSAVILDMIERSVAALS